MTDENELATPQEMLEAVMISAKHGVEAVEADHDDPGDDWMPVLLIGGANRQVTVIGLDTEFMGSAMTKDLISEIVIPGACIEFDAVALAFVSSCWMVTRGPDGAPPDFSIAPSEHPDRKEAIMVVAATLEEFEQWSAEIVRSPTLPPTLMPWDQLTTESDPNAFAGRMPGGMMSGLLAAKEARENPEQAEAIREAVDSIFIHVDPPTKM